METKVQNGYLLLADISGLLSESIKIKNKLPKFLAKPLAKIIATKAMKIYECYKKIDELSKNYNPDRIGTGIERL